MLAGYMDTHLDDAQYTNGCTLDIWIHTYMTHTQMLADICSGIFIEIHQVLPVQVQILLTATKCNNLQCYLDFRILTVCNH